MAGAPFVRELVTQELGILALIKNDVPVLIATGDDLTDSSDPSRKMMRKIARLIRRAEGQARCNAERPEKCKRLAGGC